MNRSPFVLSTPLLPFAELERWSAGLAAGSPQPPARARRAQLRSRLADLLARPEVREALLLASPSALTDLDLWRRDPGSKAGRSAEATLVRRFAQMAAVPVPGSLSAGFTTGEMAETTGFELEARSAYRRRTRLDFDDLVALADELSRDPGLRRRLVYRSNSSLRLAAGRLHYSEARRQGRLRLYAHVAVETDALLLAVLERARAGATLGELVRLLAEADPEIARGEAEEFLHELIDARLLVPELGAGVTGPEPLDGLIQELRRHGEETTAGRLERVRVSLAVRDAQGLGADPAADPALVREIEALLPSAGGSEDPPWRLHVDLVKPGRVTLGREVVAEIDRGLRLLDRLPRPPIKPLLAYFARTFCARYGDGAEIALAEALDPETGIGFASGPDFEAAVAAGGPHKQHLPGWLITRVEQAKKRGESEIRLSLADLAAEPPLSDPFGELPPLPTVFHLLVRPAAACAEALAAGDFRLWLRGLAGPSGARLLGRLCHADETLRAAVERHLRAEEALDPEAVFAEIIHLPEGTPGNAVTRPRLRDHEIPFLGRGAVDEAHRIPVDDLRVRVDGPRIRLRSARLGRRVIPRLTAAHFHGGSRQTVYRFLGALQDEGVRGGWSWNWSWLDPSPFLPRVSCGRLVFTLARWRIPREEIHRLAGVDGDRRRSALRQWRDAHRLPRWVLLEDAGGEFPIDLDHPEWADAFLTQATLLIQATTSARPAASGGTVLLTELFPAPDELCVQGPEGRFVGELILPWIRG